MCALLGETHLELMDKMTVSLCSLGSHHKKIVKRTEKKGSGGEDEKVTFSV